MKIVISESLGIKRELVLEIAKSKLASDIEIEYYEELWANNAELIERCKDADLLVIANHKLDAEVIKACPKLKMISVAFTGVDHVDIKVAHENNILVSNCSGYSTIAVADLVFGLILDLYRHISTCNNLVREGKSKAGLNFYELSGKRFGVVGTGAIGLRVIEIAKAFGCEVFAYSRTIKNLDGVVYTDLDTLMKKCDIISVHTPLNEHTKGLISKERIAMMKENAILINTARGPIVDYDALADALNADRIAGAGLDVFAKEPPLDINEKILHAKNVIATPHIGFATEEALIKRAHIAFENIAKYLADEPQNVIE